MFWPLNMVKVALNTPHLGSSPVSRNKESQAFSAVTIDWLRTKIKNLSRELTSVHLPAIYFFYTFILTFFRNLPQMLNVGYIYLHFPMFMIIFWHFKWGNNPYVFYLYTGHIRVRLSIERLPIHVHSVQNMCRQIDEILITLPRGFVHLVEKPTDLQLMNEVWHAVGRDGCGMALMTYPFWGNRKICSCLDGWFFFGLPFKRWVMDFLWA